MRKTKQFQSLEQGILLLQKEAGNESISIEKIMQILSGRGRPLIAVLLCLPFCQPLQIPGLSTPFGLAIAFIGLRIALGKHVWLPKKILIKKINSKTFKKITEKTLVFVRKIKSWIHPRLDWLCHSSFMKVMNGLIISGLGALLALPLPIPFSNIAAAWSILFIAIGVLEDDGLFVLIGYLTSLITLIFLGLTVLSIKAIF